MAEIGHRDGTREGQGPTFDEGVADNDHKGGRISIKKLAESGSFLLDLQMAILVG